MQSCWPLLPTAPVLRGWGGGRAGGCYGEVRMSNERSRGDLAHPWPARLWGPAFTFCPTDSGMCALGSQGNGRRWKESIPVWNWRLQKKRQNPVPLRLSELGFERHLKDRSPYWSPFPTSICKPVPTVSSAVCIYMGKLQPPGSKCPSSLSPPDTHTPT